MAWKNDQVSEDETRKILELARKCLEVEGDYVELGCYRGDTSLMLAEILREYNVGIVEKSVEKPAKKLWIYDSFEGLPEKKKVDFSEMGKEFEQGALTVTKREVKERFLKAELPVPVIKKGWFSDLKKVDLPEKIAFAFLDGDLYDSIKDSLRLIDDKVVSGGVVLVHDYTNLALPGVTKALDEWLRNKKYRVDRLDSLAIIFII